MNFNKESQEIRRLLAFNRTYLTRSHVVTMNTNTILIMLSWDYKTKRPSNSEVHQ